MNDVKTEQLLFDPDVEQYYQDIDNRVIWIDGEITEAISRYIKLILNWNREDTGVSTDLRTPIRIYINSYGGDLDYAMSMVELMRVSQTPIITINMGFAYSAAALLLIAGHKRLGMPNSVCMLHSGSAYLGGTYEQTISGTKMYKNMMNSVKKFILDRTEIPATKYSRQAPTDWYIDTNMALDYGIINEVIESIDSIL